MQLHFHLKGIHSIGLWARNQELFIKLLGGHCCSFKWIGRNQLLCYRLMHLNLQRPNSHNSHLAGRLVLCCHLVLRQLLIILVSKKLDEGAQERSVVSSETYTCYTWFQVRDKTGIKDLITIMIKATGITIVLTVIRATVAMEATTTLGTTIPTMDMGRDTQITVVSGFALIPHNKSMQPLSGALLLLGPWL